MFVQITGASVGWQAGVQGTDLVLVFRTKNSLQNLMAGKFTIGANASAAAGPVGREAEAATDATLKAEILSYSRSRGLFAGAGAGRCGAERRSGRDQRLLPVRGRQSHPAWPADPLAGFGQPVDGPTRQVYDHHRSGPGRHHARRLPQMPAPAILKSSAVNWPLRRSSSPRSWTPRGGHSSHCRPKSTAGTARPLPRPSAFRSTASPPWRPTPATSPSPSVPSSKPRGLSSANTRPPFRRQLRSHCRFLRRRGNESEKMAAPSAWGGETGGRRATGTVTRAASFSPRSYPWGR